MHMSIRLILKKRKLTAVGINALSKATSKYASIKLSFRFLKIQQHNYSLQDVFLFNSQYILQMHTCYITLIQQSPVIPPLKNDELVLKI